MGRSKIESSSKEIFCRKFYMSRRFQYRHPCRKHLPTSGISLFGISKQSQSYVFFRKKTFCLRVFLWTHGVLFWQLCQNSFAKKPAFSCSLPEGRNVLVSAKKTFLDMFHWTRRIHTWFVQIFFRSFCGHVGYGFDSPCAYFCQESGTLSPNVGKMIQNCFFLKKKIFLFQKFLWSHGLQFWKLCQIGFARNPKDSHSERIN